jgi:hypothetical protein
VYSKKKITTRLACLDEAANNNLIVFGWIQQEFESTIYATETSITSPMQF